MENNSLINPFNELKILTAYESIKQILRNKPVYPRTLEAYISNSCNHRCIGCHSSSFFKLKPFFMELELFKDILTEFSSLGLEGIDFSGGGEPLLHPNFNDMVRFAIRKGIKSGLVTNGIFIRRKPIKELIEKLLFIRIALDACEKKTYKKIHGFDDFHLLIENIEYLIKQKHRYGSRITIGLKFLISKFNYNEILSATRLARNLGVNYIQFKPLRNSKRHEIYNSEHDEITESLQRAQLLSTERFFVIFPVSKVKAKTRCKLSLLHPAVDVFGNIYICNFFHHRKRTHKIGNLYKNSLKEIWLSERHKNAIEHIKTEECNLYDCSFQKYTETINEIMVKDRAHLEFI